MKLKSLCMIFRRSSTENVREAMNRPTSSSGRRSKRPAMKVCKNVKLARISVMKWLRFVPELLQASFVKRGSYVPEVRFERVMKLDGTLAVKM